MFPFKKKKTDGVAPRQPVSKELPRYRMDGNAVEYKDEKEKVESRQESAADGVAVSEPQGKRFRPLPRCSHCGTALSYDQRKCHACEKELRRI